MAAITPPIPVVVPRQVTKGGAGRKNKRRGRDRKKRDDKNNKGGSCRAWFAVNHVGKYTREAHARCRVAMQDPAVRAEYESIGAQMARGGRRGKEEEAAGRPRARNPCHHEETFGWVQAAPGRGGREEGADGEP